MENNQPVYDLNEFLLNGTPVGPLLGYVSGGPIPIVPTQQQPEFNETNNVKPYMTYTWRTVPDGDTWWMHYDEISYVIWGASITELSPVASAIVNNCRALDQSASVLMDYLLGRGDIDYQFHWVKVLGSFSPDSTVQEGGRLGWVVTLRVGYSPLTGNFIQ